MSIASEITRLQGVKSDILTAIADKGVTVPAGSALDDCPSLIASIAGGGIDNVGRLLLNGTSSGVDFSNKSLFIGSPIFTTAMLEQITSSYELSMEFNITLSYPSSTDSPIFCPAVHYKSFDFQLTNTREDLFIGLSNNGTSWYNWDTINNKRIVHLSDYGISVSLGEWHKIDFSFNMTTKKMVCYFDNIKIVDIVLSITPVFDATRYNVFAAYDAVSRSEGFVKFDNWQLKINGNRYI